jgi:glycosyltransferase involved in cell wall biosynthesis
MSRIVIDARESGTSTGRYIDKLIEHLHLLRPDFEITVLTKTPRLDFMNEIAAGFDVIPSDFEEFTFAEQLGFKKQLNGLGADLVHFGMTQQPVLYRGRSITTVHDLTTLRFTNPAKNRLAFKLKQIVYGQVLRRAAHKSAAIITPSQFVKDDLVDYAGINPEKVSVTYEAADEITDPPVPTEALLGTQFLLYVGRPTPHKNLGRLIEAYKQLKAEHPELKLALAGKLDANYRRYQESSIDGLVFTDFVSDGQLKWLYENCASYVFPSLSEGFGLPGLEAMLHGAPVVSSNATCLPEVNGDAAHYFDPLDTQAIADAINEVLTDKDLRESLIAKGHEQVKKYSWQRTAEQTLEIYQRILGS